MMDKAGVYTLLNESQIAYEAYEHPAVATIDALAALELPHKEEIVKNLFLRDHKKRYFYLVVMMPHKIVDLKTLSGKIPSPKLSFANEAQLYELLGLKKGHVTPFGVLNNAARNVIVVIDSALRGQRVGVHPLENDATVFLGMEDVENLLKTHGNTILYCDL